MKFFSLKWKLSVSFILLALGFVGMYVVLATKTFESDKISYIFETKQKELESLNNTFQRQVERVTFDLRSLIAGYDFNRGVMSPGMQKVFDEHPDIAAIQLRSQGKDHLLMEKSKGVVANALAIAHPEAGSAQKVYSLGEDRYLLVMQSAINGLGPVTANVVFTIPDIFNENSEGQSMAMLSGSKVLKMAQGSQVGAATVEKVAGESNGGQAESTQMKSVEGKRYLISQAQSPLKPFQFISMVEESAALGALQVLFRRSLIFIMFSFFATVSISLILSNQLTQNINSLTRSAEKIGLGDFSVKPDFKSNDEIGVLAGAFRKMIQEIQRLLADTVDKTRMEEELKTARLVQDNLFPRWTTYENGQVRLSGLNKTTTECGGDWWFYYNQGNELYLVIADATGHGIPAALITAVARSLFSYIKDTDSTLTDIAVQWDKAISECSNGQVGMTAFLLQINVETGRGRYINAGHEPQIVMSRKDDSYSAEYTMGTQNVSLGRVMRAEDSPAQWVEDPIELKAGDRMLLFTDGLLAITGPDGRGYSEKRFLSYLQKTAVPGQTPEEFLGLIDKTFTELGQGQALPDDVTVVALDFKSRFG